MIVPQNPHGSRQLRAYRNARRDGFDTTKAAELAGITLGEARLIDADDARRPPPHEAFMEPQAPGIAASPQGEMNMARAKKNPEIELVAEPDFQRAVSIYRNDIRPAQAKVGEHAQEQSTAYKEIKKGCHVHPGAAKLAFKLEQMEDFKRDDFLRSLYGLMTEMNIGLMSDLVDQAATMPTMQRERPALMPVH